MKTLHGAAARKKSDPIPAERLVRCLWYDGRLFLKKHIRSVDGERITIVSPGYWNSGRGPDFLGCVFLAGKDRLVFGDVEVHRRRGDWKAHGHQKDPSFRAVRLHVFFAHDGTDSECRNSSGEPITEICLSHYIKQRAMVTAARIDSSRYPYWSPAPRGRCGRTLRAWSKGELRGFLCGAGEARLAEKALRIGELARRAGEEQALFRSLLEALGYAGLKSAYIKLSERLPLRLLRRVAGGKGAAMRQPIIEAAMMGVAGLIPARPGDGWDDESLRYLRRIQRAWKLIRAEWNLSPMETSLWGSWGSRPANSPPRRIAAASSLLALSTEGRLDEALFPVTLQGGVGILEKNLCRLFNISRDSYWLRRYAWGGKKLMRPVSLIGRSRRLKIIANVMLPFLCYRGEAGAARSLFRELPSLETESVTKLMITRLFGQGAPRRRLEISVQQGLVHIYNSLCARDRSGCMRCPLAEIVEKRDTLRPLLLPE